jgi:hypothetical protein
MTYHSLGKASQDEAAEELPCCRVPKLWSLFHQSLIVGFRAFHDLDLCNIGLGASVR